MENWIKNSLSGLKITPKSDNWSQISAELDSANKRRIRQVVWIFLFLAFGFSSYYYAFYSSNTGLAKDSIKEQPTFSQNISRNSIPKSPEINEKANATVLQKKTVVVQEEENHTIKMNKATPIGSLQSEKKPFIFRHSLTPKTINIKQNYNYGDIEPFPISLQINLKEAGSINLDTSQSKKTRLSKLKPTYVYSDIQFGRYLESKDLTSNIEFSRTKKLVIGLGFDLHRRLELQVGLGSYKGIANRLTGRKVTVTQKDNSSIGTSNEEGFNQTMDTLFLNNYSNYNTFENKDVYLRGTGQTIKHSITGYMLPIAVNYRLIQFNRIALKTRLGIGFNFVKDYSTLEYLDDYKVLITDTKPTGALKLNSFAVLGGFNAEYRTQHFGLNLFSAVEISKSITSTKNLFTNNLQPTVGVGLNYYFKD